MRDFGAFVSLEGFNRQGLLHISNISQYRVTTTGVDKAYLWLTGLFESRSMVGLYAM